MKSENIVMKIVKKYYVKTKKEEKNDGPKSEKTSFSLSS